MTDGLMKQQWKEFYEHFYEEHTKRSRITIERGEKIFSITSYASFS